MKLGFRARREWKLDHCSQRASTKPDLHLSALNRSVATTWRVIRGSPLWGFMLHEGHKLPWFRNAKPDTRTSYVKVDRSRWRVEN